MVSPLYTATPIAVLLLCLSQAPALAVPPSGGVKVPEKIDGVHRVDAEQLIELAETIPTLIMIDSRITTDRSHGYIEGSISLPDIDTDCDSLADISPHHSHPIMFYCNGVKCGRSVVASRVAVDCGYDTIYWFRGGFEEWRRKDYPYIRE